MNAAVIKRAAKNCVLGLDINILIRYFVQDDPVRARQSNLLRKQLRGRNLLINNIVLCERMGSRIYL